MVFGSTMKKVVFLTGTRADFGKLKQLIKAVDKSGLFKYTIFVTGMHTMARYGYTLEEIIKAGFEKNIHVFMNQIPSEPMELILSNTIGGLSRFVHEYKPDLILVHGDRIEALAGAIVGALQNILVGHIEGGEISGTVDELIRHSVSKLSHMHFVSNEEAANRLIQMGERRETIFVTGSPDVDIMMSENLPSLADVKKYYQIIYSDYAIALLHPVTTELGQLKKQARQYVDALQESSLNYIVVYPNNDEGCELIFDAYESLKDNPKFKLFPSLRFEYFLTLLKNANCIVGNSSAGVREAPIYATPTVNIGSRQQNRYQYYSIIDVSYDKTEILAGLRKAVAIENIIPSSHFGTGNSIERFMNVIANESIWNLGTQKQFCDLIPKTHD
jgi:UDP-N-acetylglucosamine 2-epimerase (hydrolysing)